MRLVVQGLLVGYGGEKLMEAVDMELAPGGLHFLIGCNGVGKSTLMRTMAGLQAPMAGAVLIDGAPVHDLPAKQRAERIAYLSGRQDIRSRITVSEFLYIGAGPKIRARSLGKQWALEVKAKCELTGVFEKRDSFLNALSDGEFQKVLITLMLLRDCPVILLDEPLSHLDPPSQLEMLELFKKLAKDHVVLVSSHQLALVEKAADSVYAIDKQGCIHVVSPIELRKQPFLEAVFGLQALI